MYDEKYIKENIERIFVHCTALFVIFMLELKVIKLEL